MSTHEYKAPIVGNGVDEIPDGYEVWFHEIRGYDSPDKWHVCKGPHGWTKEVYNRRDAIRTCVRHAEAVKSNVPDEDGEMSCYLCRGHEDLKGEACSVCGGSNSVTVVKMAETHDGRVRLARIAGPMLKDGVLPKWMKQIHPPTRQDVEMLARNPCKSCGTWLLEPGWVGSAYCSRRCCIDDHKVNPGYAATILKGYTEEFQREREAAMLSKDKEPDTP